MSAPVIYAPWTDEQVDALNALQHYRHIDAYTCHRRHEHPHDKGILLAGNDGWRCPSLACTFTQDWAPPVDVAQHPFRQVQEEITYKPGYRLLLLKDKKDSRGRWYFQVECARPDSRSIFLPDPELIGNAEGDERALKADRAAAVRFIAEQVPLSVGRGGKAYLSEHMTVSELTRTAFGLFRAYEEHECREFFKWRGKAIYGPHIEVLSLWEVADRLDYRD